MSRYTIYYLTLLLAVLFSTNATAQSRFDHYLYYLETGVLSSKAYDQVLTNVASDYLKVRVGDGWGVLDQNGVEVIPTTYQEIVLNNQSNQADFIIASADGNWGVLNSKNNVVIPFVYEHLSFINLADTVYFKAEKNGYIGLIDAEETIKLPFSYTFLTNSVTHQILTLSTAQDLYAIDALKDTKEMKNVYNSGEVVFYNALFEEIFRRAPSDDLKAIHALVTKARLMTDLIDSKGNFLVSPELPAEEISRLIDLMATPDYAFAKDSPYAHLNAHKKTLKKNTKSNFAQKQDEIYARYHLSVMGQPEGETPKPLTRVTTADGKDVLPSNTFYDIRIDNALVRPQSEKEKQHFIRHFDAFENQDDPELYHIFYFRVRDEDKSIGIYDLAGNVVIDCDEEAFSVNVHKDGLVVGKLGLPELKNTAKTALRMQPIFALYDFKGKPLLPFKYGKLGDFTHDRAIAQDVYRHDAADDFIRPNYGLINTSGAIIAPFLYADITPVNPTNPERDAYISSILIPQKGKSYALLFGLMDRDGKTIVPNQYSSIHIVENRYALLQEQLGGKHIRQSLYDLETQTTIAQFDPIYTVKAIGNKRLLITMRKGQTLQGR